MARVDWDKQLGRRLKLQALHAFCAVVERGSISQAARYFGCSQPAISALIAELEEAVGVRLLDRSTRGVEPNLYGRALLRRWTVAFDELKQGINDVQSLTGSADGELRIGCTEGVASAILQPIIERFAARHPSIGLRVDCGDTTVPCLSQLRDRNIDVCLGRWRTLPVADGDFNVDVLLDDQTVVAASKRGKWAQRSTIDLAELADQSWILTPPESWNYSIIAESFRRRGLAMPKPFLTTYSVPLRVNLVVNSEHITVFPASVLRLNHDNFGLAVLPIELPPQVWPIAIVTVRNRALKPAAQLFYHHVREFSKTLAVREHEQNGPSHLAEPCASQFWFDAASYRFACPTPPPAASP